MLEMRKYVTDEKICHKRKKMSHMIKNITDEKKC
jgi:hypothetical protein